MTTQTSTVAKRRLSWKKDKVYYINSIIVIAFMFGFGYLPPVLGLTQLGMHALGIFIGMLWGWTAVDLLWPSLLGMIATGLTGWCSIQQTFATGFSDSTVLMVLFMFVFAEYMQQTGLNRSIASWFISRKICIGRPWVFVFMLVLSSYLISSATSPAICMIIGWTIFYEICDLTGYKKKEKFPIIVLIGITYCGLLGGSIFTFRPIAGIVISSVSGITGQPIDPLIFSLTSFILSFTQMVIYVLVCKFILRPDVEPLKAAGDPFAKYREHRFTSEEKAAGVALIIILLCNFLPSILPKSLWLTGFLTKFSMTAIFATALLVFGIFRVNGEPYADIPKAFTYGVSWPTIIMLASSMPIAALMKDPASGVNDLFTTIILNLLDGAGPLMVGIIFIAFVGILTQIAHNLVLAIVLAPILANVGLQLGFDPAPIAILLAMVANLGFATPGASALGAMLFANKEWIPAKEGYFYTFTFVIISIIFVSVIGVPFVNLFF